MKVYWITSLTQLPAEAKGGILLMGNFDGFHKGHRLLIDKAEALSKMFRPSNIERAHPQENALSTPKGQTPPAAKLPVGIMTFYPHPEVLFSPQKTCFFLTSLRAKLRLAAALYIDRVYLCKFTPELAKMSSKKFIDIFLTQMIEPNHIVVGEDFKFGKNKKGTPATLRRAGFNVDTVKRDVRYSSSRARAFIEAGDIIGATHILGRPYEIEGYVKKGHEEARTLGYPTVNIPIDRFIRPALGVYATQTYMNGIWHDSLSYFGRRKFEKEPILETHIFGYTGNLYHKRLRVRFIDFIRKPQKFKNALDVKHQLAADGAVAKSKLARQKNFLGSED